MKFGFLVIGKLMLHFDSLAGGTSFLAPLFKLPIIHIHNYQFFHEHFFSERNTSTTTYFYELKCGRNSSRFHMNDMRNSKGSNALRYERNPKKGKVVGAVQQCSG
jgi:hypothetical protein